MPTFDTLLMVVGLTGLAGAAIPLGGLIARVEHIQPYWLEQELRHTVIAFGGGVLIAAVALVLVPEGVKELAPWAVVASMLAGGAVFCLMDVALLWAGTSAAQLLAMLADFLPEALALGAGFATKQSVGLLLTLLIVLQNLPEGFNAYRELASSGRMRGGTILRWFFALVPLGPLAAVVGLVWLTPLPHVVGSIMLFAAGGILYLTFQDIAPQAKLARHWAPSLGAVVGFLVGLVGQMVLVLNHTGDAPLP